MDVSSTTLNVIDFDMLFDEVTVNVTSPNDFGVILPLLSIVATNSFDEVHITFLSVVLLG